MQSPNLRKASVWSVAEVVVSTIGMFLILKIILEKLGTEALGIWSLVVASTLLLRLSDAGISAVVPRFVGAAFGEGNRHKAREFADTAFCASFVVYAFSGAMLTYPLSLAIGLAMPAESLAQARQLLPYAIVGFVVMNLGQTAQATVVGLHQAPLKSMIAVASIPLQVLFLWVLTDRIGLVGVVFAQIIQTIFVIIASRLCASRIMTGTWASALVLKASWVRLKEIYSLGLKIQFASIASLGFDPLVKFTLSACFGLQAVGYYEIANRIAAQARQVVVMPTQALLPLFAATYALDRKRFDLQLSEAMANIIFFASILGLMVVLASPLISIVIINEVNHELVGMIIVLSAGWMINAMAAPSFLAAISADISRWNMAGQWFATLAAPAALWSLRGLGDPVLAIAGAMLMLAIGAVMMIWRNSVSLSVRAVPPPVQIFGAYKTLARFVGK